MRRFGAGLAIVLALIGLLVAALLASLETDWFARRLSQGLSEQFQREVVIGAPLDIDWSLRPVVRAQDVRVGAPDWAGPAPTAAVAAMAARFDPRGLFRGELTIEQLVLERPELALIRAADGRASWDGLTGGGEGGSALPFELVLAALTIRDGRLLYQDALQSTRLELAVHTRQGEAGAPTQLLAEGRGERSGKPLRIDFVGGPPLALDQRERPYPVDLRVRSAGTRIAARGGVRRPLALEGGELDLQVSGPDPADLLPLLGLSLPQLPPYDVRGRLTFGDGVWRFQDFSGRFGDSDIAGDMTIEAGERPLLRAELRSRRLDLDDLLPAVGGTPSTAPGETASSEQRRDQQARQGDQEVLPERKASRGRWQAMNAEVSFVGKRVNATATLPLDDLSLRATLEDGVLRFHPLDFGVGGGEVRTQVSLDSREQPLRGRVQARLRRVDLQKTLRGFRELTDKAYGVVRGQAELRFRGDSVEQALSSLDGNMLLYMSGGEVNALLVELLGLDAGEAAAVALTRDKPVDIQCSIAQFEAEQGVARIKRLLVASDDSNIYADGSVDFRRERLDLRLETESRDPSLLTGSSPITVRGSFAEPDVSVVSGELIAKGVAAVIAGLLAPPLAIAPFVELGSGEDMADTCRELTAAAKREVKTEQAEPRG